MTEYNPPISTRETYDLIAIANSTTFDWEQDAIDQAKNELLKRGVTIEYQKEILSQWEEIENQLENSSSSTVGEKCRGRLSHHSNAVNCNINPHINF